MRYLRLERLKWFLKVQFAFHAWCYLHPGGWASTPRCCPQQLPPGSSLLYQPWLQENESLGISILAGLVQGIPVVAAPICPLLGVLFGACRMSSSPAFSAVTPSTPPCTTASPGTRHSSPGRSKLCLSPSPEKWGTAVAHQDIDGRWLRLRSVLRTSCTFKAPTAAVNCLGVLPSPQNPSANPFVGTVGS